MEVDLFIGAYLKQENLEKDKREAYEVGEKFTRNFRVNREMREKNCVLRPPNAKFLIEIGMKLQGDVMANFQILVPKSNFEFEIKFSMS